MRMRNAFGGVAAVATLFATPVAAWTPVSTGFTLSGTVNGCPFTGTLTTDAGGSASITAAAPLCGIVFIGTPYAVTAPSSASIKISNVTVSFPSGVICRGDLIGAWNNSTGEMSFNTTLSGSPCSLVKFVGTISTAPQLFM